MRHCFYIHPSGSESYNDDVLTFDEGKDFLIGWNTMPRINGTCYCARLHRLSDYRFVSRLALEEGCEVLSEIAWNEMQNNNLS